MVLLGLFGVIEARPLVGLRHLIRDLVHVDHVLPVRVGVDRLRGELAHGLHEPPLARRQELVGLSAHPAVRAREVPHRRDRL